MNGNRKVYPRTTKIRKKISLPWQSLLEELKKRHPELQLKLAVRFDSKREDWCNYKNFERMYSGVYAAMVNSRVAIEPEEESYG